MYEFCVVCQEVQYTTVGLLVMTVTVWVYGGSCVSSNVSGFFRDFIRQMWINFSEGKERGRMEVAGIQADSVSSKILSIMDYLSGKEERQIKGKKSQSYGSAE